jgi:hypothetical protein
MSFLKENGGLLVVGAAILAILAGYMEWRISAAVSAQLTAADIVPPLKIETMEGDIKENSDDIGDIEDRWNRLVDAIAAK